MRFFTSIKNKSGILYEFLNFLWKRKLAWMIPLVILLLLLVAVLVIGSASGLAPFIYTLI
jgi:hypothetical protein